MAIDPRGADLKRYLQEDPGGPVVMLNLLRFAEGGRESYDQYAKALSETFLPRYGGEVLYAGDGGTPLVAEQGQDWDAVLLVRYPSREAFSRMVADPEYQQVTHLRTQALTEAVLQPTDPLVAVTGPDEGTPARGRLARTARLAALPAAYAGRTALGLGKRLGGRPAEVVAEQVQQRTAEQLFATLGHLKGGAMKMGQAS